MATQPQPWEESLRGVESQVDSMIQDFKNVGQDIENLKDIADLLEANVLELGEDSEGTAKILATNLEILKLIVSRLDNHELRMNNFFKVIEQMAAMHQQTLLILGQVARRTLPPGSGQLPGA